MSHKGKVFTESDVPRRLQGRWTKEQKTAWIDEQNRRYKIIAIDENAEQEGDKPIIAEELDQRALNTLSPKARRIAGMLKELPLELRAEVLGSFNSKGELVYPFRMV